MAHLEEMMVEIFLYGAWLGNIFFFKDQVKEIDWMISSTNIPFYLQL